MTKVEVLVVLLLISVVTSISIKNRKLIDDEGRQIIIHGTNVVVKVPPYQPRVDSYDPQWSFSEQDMINCTRLGYNGIRLGMMWAGVEPQKDTYNQTYLDQMEILINKAGKHGIYTLIDFHQDLIAQKFCGDGIPTWLANELKLYKTFPFPMGKKIKLNQSGLPGWDKCDTNGWGKYYFSYDVGHTFNQLYRIGSHLNKKFTDFWVKIAKRFKGNPYVLGYQLINQPFVGNAIRDLFLVIPSVAQRVKFQNFYDNLVHEIRKWDEDTIIFFQPITFDNTIPVGFTHPPGGHRYANKSVLAYHYYHPPALGYNTIDKRIQDGKRLGVVSFLSEFGGSDGEVLGRAMKYQQSWLYWIYKSYGKNWGSNWRMQKNSNQGFSEYGVDGNHSMTYLQRVAGQIIDENFNFKSKHYVGHYLASPQGKSILYFSRELNYPHGHELQVNPKSLVTYKEVRPGYYELTFLGNESKIVQISITAL